MRLEDEASFAWRRAVYWWDEEATRWRENSAAADDVKTTRLTDLALAEALSTFSTPLIAGFIISFCITPKAKLTGVATWKTNSQPSTGASMLCSSVRSAHFHHFSPSSKQIDIYVQNITPIRIIHLYVHILTMNVTKSQYYFLFHSAN